MQANPLHILSGASRAGATPARTTESLVIAGATGALGNAVVQLLVGGQRFGATTVMARESIKTGMRGVGAWVVPGPAAPALAIGANDLSAIVKVKVKAEPESEPESQPESEPQTEPEPFEDWPLLVASTGVVLFDPPRMYYQRERALWTPTPAQLPALARWMRAGGVRTLAVVMPHVQGQLPDALKRGLANLDEQAVASLGFERLLIVRSAEKPRAIQSGRSWPARAAHGVLAAMRYMVPGSEQPVRATKVAELVDRALRYMPAGTHVAPPELVWRAAQGDLPGVVDAWLHQPAADLFSSAKSKHMLHEPITR